MIKALLAEQLHHNFTCAEQALRMAPLSGVPATSKLPHGQAPLERVLLLLPPVVRPHLLHRPPLHLPAKVTPDFLTREHPLLLAHLTHSRTSACGCASVQGGPGVTSSFSESEKRQPLLFSPPAGNKGTSVVTTLQSSHSFHHPTPAAPQHEDQLPSCIAVHLVAITHLH